MNALELTRIFYRDGHDARFRRGFKPGTLRGKITFGVSSYADDGSIKCVVCGEETVDHMPRTVFAVDTTVRRVGNGIVVEVPVIFE